MSRPRHAVQFELPRHAGWGGKRTGAGRKPAGPRPRVSHATRPDHQARHPVHVTLRALPDLGSLRDCPAYPALEDAIAAAAKADFRVCEFSVQFDHLHLIVEAHDRDALRRGMQGLAVRCARAVNRVLGRRGKVFVERYHARALKTPREVRNGLVSVLQNWRKSVAGAQWLDGCSSARWFDGWRGPRPDWARPPPGATRVTRAARTWLLREGWRRHGLIRLDEVPRDARE
jgi:hypothetical protein